MSSDLTNWLLVFVRAGAMLTVFPIFSITNVPRQVRLALGALLALLVAPMTPDLASPQDLWGLIGVIALELGFGLLLGFTSRMVFYALDIAGNLLAAEIGLSMPTSINPMTASQSTDTANLLNYLAAMLWLSLNLHHSLLLAFRRSFVFLPIGGGHLSETLLLDVVGRTTHLFAFALQLAAPLVAVSFIITLVFAVLSRAVPQMNVFSESFGVRLLAGLTVFGLTCQLMGQHIANYLRRLPEDVLRVAQLLGGA